MDSVKVLLVEDYKIPFYPIDAPKFIRKFTLKNLGIPIKLFKCIKQCKAKRSADFLPTEGNLEKHSIRSSRALGYFIRIIPFRRQRLP